MVILFILVGSLVGAGAASVAWFSGGSFLFALLCYSVFGSLSGLLALFALFLRIDAKTKPPNGPRRKNQGDLYRPEAAI